MPNAKFSHLIIMIKNNMELHNGYKQRMTANHIFDKDQVDNHWEKTVVK